MNRQKIRLGEQGLASIIITSFLMLMLGLLVIGFGRIVVREQRQALDRQLSAQAQYAAESGVNEAIQKIKLNPDYSKTSCAPDVSDSAVIDSNTSYPCLLVNNKPTSLDFSDVSTEESEFMILKPDSGPVGSLQIAWQAKEGNVGPTDFRGVGSNNFPDFSSWNAKTGIIRAEVIPIPNGTFSRQQLRDARRVFFFYPVTGSAGLDGAIRGNDSALDGSIVPVVCNTANNSGALPKHCAGRITHLGSSDAVFLRIRGIYRNASATISTQNNQAYASGNNIQGLKGEQVVIDATGKAGDVLKRQRVHLDITPSGANPEGVIETINTLCKRIQVGPGFATTDTTDPSCAIPVP